MKSLKQQKPKIKGTIRQTSTHKLGGQALKTTKLFQQFSNFGVERTYDNINPRLWALAKHRKWDEAIQLVEMNKSIIEPDWISPMSYDHNNALHFAAMDNCLEICESLIKICRYSPHKKNRLNKTAITISEKLNHDLMCRMLNWYKPINVWRRTYKDNLFGAKGRIVSTHKKYKKKRRKKLKPQTDEFGEAKFTGKKVDQFKEEWLDLKKTLKYDRIRQNMKKKKLHKKKKTERKLARKAISEGFLPSLKGMR